MMFAPPEISTDMKRMFLLKQRESLREALKKNR